MTHVTEIGGPDPTGVIGRRLVAAFVDSMLQVIVLGAALLVMGTSFADVGAVAGAGATQFGTLELGQLAVAILLSLMFALVNRVILVAVHGWTLGKLFVGLRCVNALGRPPGMVPALIRGLVMYLIEGILGFLGSMLLLLSILATRGHRSLADLAAKTFVIDSAFEGRLIFLGDRRAAVGPESVTRDEASRLGYDVSEPIAHEPAPGVAITGTAEPPAPPPGVEGTPSYDPSLRTYVIFDGATGNWLKLRRTSGEWVSMDGF
jgi:uncharacterized RDD family membrane protein YckC